MLSLFQTLTIPAQSTFEHAEGLPLARIDAAVEQVFGFTDVAETSAEADPRGNRRGRK